MDTFSLQGQQITNRRAYKRDPNFCTEAKVSLDGEIWHSAQIFDISASGLKFLTNVLFDIGEDLWFDLEIPEFLHRHEEIKIKGTICRQENEDGGKFVYGVAFSQISHDLKIQIDENIMLRSSRNFQLKKKKKPFEN
ncbi:MAG: PilZ domain-containing protein [Oscillospiraceae bacterium]|nr:PilZ domain-containing protein [Oscillospiraceae bacterium]